MKQLFIYLFLCVNVFCCFNSAEAQYYANRNKVWVFGYGAGLDFKSGIPIPISTNIHTVEGCASVSDEFGNLLFYSDGQKVYNKSGTIMPNGNSIVSYLTNSSSQAALIVPVIGNNNQYYLFSLEQTNSDGRLSFSIVDMRLDGGLGDVLASKKGIIFADSLSEKMIAIAGNNNNIWIVVHSEYTQQFLSYEVTVAGINNVPVTSNVGTFFATMGVIKASPNRRKIVVQSYGSTFGTQLFDFDPTTGFVSNCFELDSSRYQYGAEFSPDNTKLYLATYASGGEIFQFNLAAETTDAIKSSKFLVQDSIFVETDLKLAPDSKIYLINGRNPVSYLDCIASPNLSGNACNYRYHDISLLSGTMGTMGLPNLVVTTDTVNTAIVKSIGLEAIIDIYPNPTQNTLTITSANKITSISIYDLVGELVYFNSCNSEKLEADVSNLMPGVYFVKINEIEVKRFVKE